MFEVDSFFLVEVSAGGFRLGVCTLACLFFRVGGLGLRVCLIVEIWV